MSDTVPACTKAAPTEQAGTSLPAGGEVCGLVHSLQSLGAVDGPGIRYVIFLQGCPYHCPYCHNPDTRPFSGGTRYTVGELMRLIRRYRPYFGKEGGVTVSGGEPLVQAGFVTELFRALRKEGISTALDTAGMPLTEEVRRVLVATDYVLCDIKTSDFTQYRTGFGMEAQTVERFLSAVRRAGCTLWVRHVVVPGLTDSPQEVRAVAQLAQNAGATRLELLPFHRLSDEKYQRLGIPFPLADTPPCPPQTVSELYAMLTREGYGHLIASATAAP